MVAMNFDRTAIAGIATVIGVSVGIISLVFVIYEVRRNARAIEGTTVQSLLKLESQVFAPVSPNASLLRKCSADLVGLSEDDLLKFGLLVCIQMSLYYSASVQFQQHLIDQKVWDAYLNAVQSHMTHPGLAEIWTTFESNYPKSFLTKLSGYRVVA